MQQLKCGDSKPGEIMLSVAGYENSRLGGLLVDVFRQRLNGSVDLARQIKDFKANTGSAGLNHSSAFNYISTLRTANMLAGQFQDRFETDG